MEVVFKKTYLKELKRLPKQVIDDANWVTEKLRAAKSLQDSGLQYIKMEGQRKDEHYYRIRIGDYRMGIEYIHPKTIVITIVHRGKVYKSFPPK